MGEALNTAWELLLSEKSIELARAGLLLVLGLPGAWLLGWFTRRVTRRFWPIDYATLARRVVYWTVVGLVVASALRQLGFDLGVLLGAAGIVTVAIGFASQTSASNLISGLFLTLERAFGVGDIIQMGSTVGEVLSVDLLSVKIRTFDNRFVRIPNESLVKSEITNLTRFRIRRADVFFEIAYKEDIARVRALLFAMVEDHPDFLEEPRPVFWINQFASSGVSLQFSAWVESEEFFPLRTELYRQVKACLDEHGIEIPFPHVSLYTGTATEPLPVRVEAEPRSSRKTRASKD